MTLAARSILALLALLALTVATPAMAQQKDSSLMADLAMKEASESFRKVADQFAAAASKGDVETCERLISPNMKGRAGAENVKRVLTERVVPFFAQWGGAGRSETIANTTDGFGSQGFVFYRWMQPRSGGDPRPYVLYVVSENGSTVVANVTVDQLVPGRHQ
jgi:hypothetical protein